MLNKRISFIGAGKMAEAFINGLIKSNYKAKYIAAADSISDRLSFISLTYHIKTYADNMQAARAGDLIILSVKPQSMKAALTSIKGGVDKSKIIVSIAAGVTTDSIKAILGDNIKVVRAMPNTPALVHASATAFTCCKNITKEDIEVVTSIFDSVGISVQVDESAMDAVTGLSGSGPAYIFLIMEAFVDAGIKAGLPRNVAKRLVKQMLFGAAKMALETDNTLYELKGMVTSPGGTSISGIHALERGGIRGIIMDAVESATKRSIELGGK